MFINCFPVLDTRTLLGLIVKATSLPWFFATQMFIKVAEKVSNELPYYLVNVHVDDRSICMQSHSHHHITNNNFYNYLSSNVFSLLYPIFSLIVFPVEIFMASLYSYSTYILRNQIIQKLTAWCPYNWATSSFLTVTSKYTDDHNYIVVYNPKVWLTFFFYLHPSPRNFLKHNTVHFIYLPKIRQWLFVVFNIKSKAI